MNQLQVFTSQQFGQIRVVAQDGEPWFVGKDVADVLGYKNPRKAMIDHVDEEDKGVTKCDTLGGKQNTVTINESGLYSLILSSKLPTAKKFKHWVTSDVIPSIRKSGGYIARQETMSDAELMAKALLVAQRQIEDRERLIEEMKPAKIFADAVCASEQTILVGDLAKLIKQNGVDIGQRRLFEWLRLNGYLIKRKGSDWNMPTQRSMDMGLFEIKETAITHSDGHVTISKTVKVTGRGQRYFINKFLS